MNNGQKAFTLVELAIVITIIGLLIGGVLKGQELLENARITGTATQLASYATATITFKDIYKAYPGDIRDPQNFIQGCTATPCNISGDGDGTIGTVNSSGGNDENFTFWVHLTRAGLLAGVDPNMTWTITTYHKAMPSLKMGGQVKLSFLSAPSFYNFYPIPFQGYQWETFISDSTGANGLAAYTPATALKYDLKTDDGKPLTGDVRAIGTASTYDLNSATMVTIFMKAAF